MPPPPVRRTTRLTAAAVVSGLAAATVVTSTASATPAPKVPVAATASPAASPADAAPAATTLFGLRRGQSLVREGSSSTLPNSLISAGLPPPGSSTVYSGFGTKLVLQSDGNLVEYETTTGAVLFSSNTRDGASLVYQDDGNVVLYTSNGVARFSSNTGGDTRGVVFSAYGNGQLLIQTDNGSVVSAFGTPVVGGPGVVYSRSVSPNGRYQLVVQGDGNIVAYDNSTGRGFWSTGTFGVGAVRFAAQADGNLVVYQVSTGRAVWASNSSGPQVFYQLDMQNDGNIVLYLTNGVARIRAVWASGTSG